MSIIGSLPGSHYSLNEELDKTQTARTTVAAATPVASASHATPGDSVTLSAEAQAYLAKMTQAKEAEAKQFTLSERQKDQISAILARYADAPFTQDTYNAIQYDLAAEGLSADQLALREQVFAFNATQSFMDALNGVAGSSDSFSLSGAEKADPEKANSYMRSIVKEWASISTTYEEDA